MKTVHSKRFFLGAVASGVLAFLAASPATVHAQAGFPSKPVRVLVPFPAGGAIDSFVRTIAPELSAQLGGQPVLVINKPGGGSQIAAGDLLASPADGHTVFVAQTGDFSVNPHLYKNINYVPPRDFDGIGMFVRAPQVMLANPTGKINSVATLKSEMSKQGGSVLYGSFAPGTAPHLLGHILSKSASGGKFTHVPYKGFPPTMQAIMTNEIDLLFDAVPGTLNMQRTGKVIPLAIADTARNSHLPNVPTTAEIGFPQLVMDFWIGAAVKKGTPRAIVNRLNEAFAKAVAAPDVMKKFDDLGYSRVSMSAEQFDAFVNAEFQRMKPVIAETGVTVD
jgi:tripartite-type tricarboxylate transporter receptor subunit TctC